MKFLSFSYFTDFLEQIGVMNNLLDVKVTEYGKIRIFMSKSVNKVKTSKIVHL